MAWYNTGNIALTNGSATVTGSGTNFLVGAQIGEALYAPDGKLYEIQTIDSATVITLASTYLGSTASGQNYQIIPTQSLVADLASDVTDLISDFANVRDYAGNGKFNDGAVGTPGITFTQDQDNGLYRIGANNWALAAGGQQVVNLTTTAMNFPDNNKAIFGAGSDLQIYSDGTTGQVTGNVNVTGTVTADGLTSSGPINLTAGALAAAGNAGLSHRSTDNKVYLQAGTGGFNILDDQQNTHFYMDPDGAATFNSNASADSFGFTQNSAAVGIQDAIFRSTTGRIEVRAGNVDDMLVIDGTNGVIVNDGSVDRDFRVESDSLTSALFVDGDTGNVTMQGPTTTIGAGLASTNVELRLSGVDGKASRIKFSDGVTDRWLLGQGAASETSAFELYNAGGVIALSVDRTSNIATFQRGAVFNESGEDSDFRIESDTGSHMLFVDASGGYVTVGRETNLGSSIFTVQSNNGAGLAIGYGTGTNEYRRLYHHSSGLYFESTTNQAYLNAAGVWTDASDITYKKDIEDIDYGIETVKKLKPRKYKMKSDDQAQIGFVAQELVEQVPEIVSEKDGILGVAYGQLTAVLTKAIQEQQEIIETLEARIAALES